MFVNATPFAALDVPTLDPIGREVVVAIVKGTFEVDEQGRVRRAEVQIPVRTTDVPLDAEARASSVRYPSDVGVAKGGTDVIVVGEALSRAPVAALDLGVRIRDFTCPLRVHGPRVFYRRVAQVVVGPAARFERMPVVYEKAYGGATADGRAVDLRNPVGLGVAAREADLIDAPAPQIEHPARPHETARDRHPPGGFGAIAPHWSPRLERWGTVDEVWRTTRMPLPPRDYDPRHASSAHPDLFFERSLEPGDPIGVVGMTLSGALGFEIPAFRVVVRGRLDDGAIREVRPPIDTLLLETGPRRFELATRAAMPLGRAGALLRELVVDVDG